MLTARPRGHFDHHRIVVVEKSQQIEPGESGGQLGDTIANPGIGIPGESEQCRLVEQFQTCQRSERGIANRSRHVFEPIAHGVEVTGVSGEHDQTALLGVF